MRVLQRWRCVSVMRCWSRLLLAAAARRRRLPGLEAPRPGRPADGEVACVLLEHLPHLVHRSDFLDELKERAGHAVVTGLFPAGHDPDPECVPLRLDVFGHGCEPCDELRVGEYSAVVED